MSQGLARVSAECRCGFIVSARSADALQQELDDHVTYAHPTWNVVPVVDPAGAMATLTPRAPEEPQ